MFSCAVRLKHTKKLLIWSQFFTDLIKMFKGVLANTMRKLGLGLRAFIVHELFSNSADVYSNFNSKHWIQPWFLMDILFVLQPSFLLSVKQAPKITAQPLSLTAYSLDDVNLPCEASGDPAPR